jgi:hypothetical protein
VEPRGALDHDRFDACLLERDRRREATNPRSDNDCTHDPQPTSAREAYLSGFEQLADESLHARSGCSEDQDARKAHTGSTPTPTSRAWRS